MKTITCDSFAIHPKANPSNWSFDLMLVDGRFPMRGVLPHVRVAARSIHQSHGTMQVEIGSGPHRREFTLKCRNKLSSAYHAKVNGGAA